MAFIISSARWLRTLELTFPVMAKRYAEKIKQYCETHGIEIPLGFYRHPASRYAAVDQGATPPKLVAKTWLKHEDVVYYLTHLAQGKRLTLLDFKERCELRFNGKETLDRTNEF